MWKQTELSILLPTERSRHLRKSCSLLPSKRLSSTCLCMTEISHQRLAKMRVVKDNTKGNDGRPFFVCSDRKNPCSFWQWEMLPRVLNQYVNMTKYVVCPKSRKMVLTMLAYSTVVLEIEKTPVDSLNGNPSRTHRVFIKLGASLPVRGSTSTWLQILIKHLQVKMTLKRITKNSFTGSPLTNSLKIWQSRLTKHALNELLKLICICKKWFNKYFLHLYRVVDLLLFILACAS